MRNRCRAYRVLVAAGASVAMLAIAAAPAAADCELKLGIIGVMSGPAAQWGLALRGAAEMVAAEANHEGGLPVGNQKCKVSTVAIDSKYTAEGARRGRRFWRSAPGSLRASSAAASSRSWRWREP